jgi:hypothetical protein
MASGQEDLTSAMAQRSGTSPPEMAALLAVGVALLLGAFALSRGGRDRFWAARVNSCSDAQAALPEDPAPAFHRWTGPGNRNWTAEVTPWDPDSRIQLTAAALTPGSRQEFLPINPITRIGATSRLRTWANPFTPSGDPSGPCNLQYPSLWEPQPFQPDYYVPAQNDGSPDAPRAFYQALPWDAPPNFRDGHSVYGGPYRPLAPGCPAPLNESGIGDPMLRSRREYLRPADASLYFPGEDLAVEGQLPPFLPKGVAP